MSWIALGIGLVLVFEGLAFAFLPDRIDQVLAALAEIPREKRRVIGLVAVGAGVALVWLARAIGV